ncbi:hypothetical protein ACRXCV_11280 [Halobacteriovorax sp. GFR7]|uniref:hypothetical protein n=1 Tax=unclassified Halobacteriovorax TaxID=2639665 RepID=UPI003D96E876
MRKLILPFLLLLLVQNGHSFASDGVNCVKGTLETLDSVNEENIRKIANVRSYGANPNYPKDWPANMKEIMQPSVKGVCDAYATANKIMPTYNSIMENIDKTYPGGHREFFYKYVLTMDCWAFRENFFDDTSKDGNYSSYLGTVMKSQFGGVDPNAYIRINREGKIVEGPIFHVFAYLEKNYPNSKRAREYAAVMRRLRSGKRFNLFPVKSIEEIKKEDPDMPINVN